MTVGIMTVITIKPLIFLKILVIATLICGAADSGHDDQSLSIFCLSG